MKRIRENEDCHSLEGWGLSASSAAELTSIEVVGPFDHYDKADVEFARMLEDGDSNHEIFERYTEIPRVG